MQDRTDLAFLFIGGEHQVLHLAPVAAEVSRRRTDLVVRCLCADAPTAAALHAVGVAMHAPAMQITQVPVPALSTLLAWATGRHAATKGPLLARIRRRIRDARAIIVPERTSAALRKLGWRRPLIHFRHGAGDRAPSSEERLDAFDAIFVPGQKDMERAVGRGIESSRLHAVGYIKLDYLQQASLVRPSFFENDRPIIVYNPHFDRAISSIGIARDVILRFHQQDRYNLIFAPHVRAFEDVDAGGRADWAALAVPGRIMIDLGSPALFDMRYLRAANLYLGDMSSQLYEFLAQPRPVAFLNAHGVTWRDDPRYAGWHLGEVASGAVDVLDTIDRAFERQPERIERQRQAMAFAFGDYHGAIDRAATILLDLVCLGGGAGDQPPIRRLT